MTNNNPLVSIIIPAYNMELYLAETLDSVLASIYTNFEIIIMDDGSKDRTLAIANEYAQKDARVKVYQQPNGGACAARNHAISLAKGELILPVDADNTITDFFIGDAVKIFVTDPEVKVVCPRADFFGDRKGEWKLPPFDIHLLARKNIMDTCAMYRKADWERVGGYCNEILTREDWDFWMSVLKDGGKVVKLPKICFHYRIRGNSKRVTNRKKLTQVIDIVNKRHPEFFERELGGPLRHLRTYSRLINFFNRLFHPRKVFVNPSFTQLNDFMKVFPIHWKNGMGKVIYQGRNELREVERNGVTMVVKSFRKPNIINQIIYGIFRSSKAERSYRYAEMLLKNGIHTPQPVAFYTERNGILFNQSYYACLKSECPYTYKDLFLHEFPNQEEILRSIARVAARMHDLGYLHKDFSRGNILFKETPQGIRIEIIDLNRIRFQKVDMQMGCQNFERLPGTPDMLRIMADEYAKARGFDAKACFEILQNVCTEKI